MRRSAKHIVAHASPVALWFCALVFPAPPAGAAQLVDNSGFETPDSAAVSSPALWRTGGDGYEIVIDPTVSVEGASSLRIRRIAPEAQLASWGQVLPVSEDAERLVRLSGWIRTDSLEGGYAGLWLQLNGESGLIFMDNMRGRGVSGTSEWAQYEIETVAGPEVESIVVGGLVAGRGTAWFDDIEFETVSLDDLGPPSPEAFAFLEGALDTLQAHTLRSDSIEWSTLRALVLRRAAGSQTASDAYAALRWALAEAGDHHGFLMEPSEARTWETRTAAEATVGRGIQGGVIEGRFGHIELPGFTTASPEAQLAYAREGQELVEELAQTPVCGWVVDLRANDGGNMWPMLAGLSALLGPEEVGFHVRPDGSRSSWRTALAHRSPELPWAHPIGEEIPVAVLTSRRTASAAEAVAVAFRGRADTRSFGQRTAGFSTSVASFPLSDGALLFVTTGVYADRNGVLFGGSIEPDQVVAQPEGSLQTDAVMDAALAWLSSHSACTR